MTSSQPSSKCVLFWFFSIQLKQYDWKFRSSWLSHMKFHIAWIPSWDSLWFDFMILLDQFWRKNLEPFWLLEGEECHIDYSFFDCPFYSTWHLPWKWFKIDVWYIGAGKEATWSDFCRTQRDTRSIPNVRAMAGRRTALQVFAVIDTVFNLDCNFSPFSNVDCRSCHTWYLSTLVHHHTI